MKASEVYRKAAKSIAELKEDYSCIAICNVHDQGYFAGFPLRDEYRENFIKGDECHLQAMIERCANRREIRVLALCFMAAIAEDEERGKGRRSS